SASDAEPDTRARKESGRSAGPGDSTRAHSFLSEILPKIQQVCAICARCGVDPIIEVDGGENRTTAAEAVAAGATAIVRGSAIFGAKDYAGAIAAIRADATVAATRA